MASYDAIIIGAGVNGCSIAYQLSKRGKKALVLEKQQIAAGASRAAAGMLGAQSEFKEESPLFKLARQSRRMFPRLAEELKETCGMDIELINKGMLKLALSPSQLTDLKEIYDAQRKLDLEICWVSGDEARKWEPNLSDTVQGGIFLPEDGHVNPLQLTLAFAKAAVEKGAEIREYSDVHSILFDRGKVAGVKTDAGDIYSRVVILAAGAWSKRFLPEGELHTYPVKGECFSVASVKPLITRTIFTEGCYIVPKRGGRILVGATEVEGTFHEGVTFGGISSLMEKAKEILPEIQSAQFEKAWSGIRPQTGDGLPYIGEHPAIAGLFIATGHYRNGIVLSPLTGQLMADMVEGTQVDPVLLSAFRMERNWKEGVEI